MIKILIYISIVTLKSYSKNLRNKVSKRGGYNVCSSLDFTFINWICRLAECRLNAIQ